MLKSDVIHHFGSVGEVAKSLGITSQAVSMWPDTVPLVRQYQLEKLTDGVLKADPHAPKHTPQPAPAAAT